MAHKFGSWLNSGMNARSAPSSSRPTLNGTGSDRIPFSLKIQHHRNGQLEKIYGNALLNRLPHRVIALRKMNRFAFR